MAASFAAKGELACEGGIEEDDCVNPQRSVLSCAETHDIDANLPRQFGRGAAGEIERIGEACAVHVELEPLAVSQSGDRRDLVRSVNGTALGGLCDRHRGGLWMMYDAVDRLGKRFSEIVGIDFA